MSATATDLTGTTAMVTGASSGIGRITARELARRGAAVLLVCRDPGRGEETAAAIRAESPHAPVQLLLADLAVQAEIRRLAEAFLATGAPLHLLINNAGVVNLQHSLTADGIETVFAVNHLAYFLLTLLLLERMKASAPARIVNVASEAHKLSGIDFDDLGGERRYRAMRIYGQSKLANLLFTRELARRLEGTGVTVNAVHPGAVATGLGKNNGAWAQRLIGMLRPFFRTPEQGAATSLHVATSPAVAGVSGKYFRNGREARPARTALDDAVARRLWQVSAAMTGVDA